VGSYQVEHEAIFLGEASPVSMKCATDHHRPTHPDTLTESVLDTDFSIEFVKESAPPEFPLRTKVGYSISVQVACSLAVH
jgi:hypothetical protein